MDYYSILGVGRNASQDEIKRAYRKLAMQHHPDRGGSAEKLQQINEAYDTLKDPTKRSQYDNPQANFRADNFGPNPFDFDDIMSQAFGRGGFGFHRPMQRNRDVNIIAEIDFEDIFTGKTLYSSYTLRSGRKETVEINIPIGIDHGQMIRYAGLGDDSVQGMPRGNLIVKIKVRKKKGWERKGFDLFKTLQIDVFDAILGTEVNINTADEKNLSLKIPKGTQPGTTFSIHGYGVPNIKTGKRGTIFIKVNLIIPKILDEEQIKLLEKIKDGVS